jgi:hypothetical protein
MIGRKFAMVQNGQIIPNGKNFSDVSYLEELKHTTKKGAKKYTYLGLVMIIRFYVKFTNILKNIYREMAIKINNIKRSHLKNNPIEKQEIPKFLKIISEYKQKIREIKHRINKEEENNF